MSTYIQFLYQFVFTTKYRKNTLDSDHIEVLYCYIRGIFKKRNCVLYKIGGTENHIHIICHLHPMVMPARMIQDVKLGASWLIKEKKLFPLFNGWQKGYGGFTYHIRAKKALINYVANQKEHHSKISFDEEYTGLLKEHGVEYDTGYIFE